MASYEIPAVVRDAWTAWQPTFAWVVFSGGGVASMTMAVQAGVRPTTTKWQFVGDVTKIFVWSAFGMVLLTDANRRVSAMLTEQERSHAERMRAANAANFKGFAHKE